MLKLIVVDCSAERRNRIVEELSALLREDSPERDFVPQLSINPLSPEELKFHGAPDICIIGDGIIERDISEVAQIKKIFPQAALIARTNERLSTIAVIEQLARFGVDDTIAPNISSSDFLRKIVLLARRTTSSRTGKLILVDSGKGGLGVTSLTAALGEALVEQEKRVCLVDFDFQTQDLSRFLQARPFVNENLQLLFDESRPVTQEYVEQCLTNVWEGDDSLLIMSPTSERDTLFESRANHARTLVAILEVIDALFDFVVIDTGCARGKLLRTLYRVADQVLFVVNNDPATLYASADRLNQVRGMLSVGSRISVIDNCSKPYGLPDDILREEFSLAARIEENDWLTSSVPFCKNGVRWPGSGHTLFSHGTSSLTRSLTTILEELDCIPRSELGSSSKQTDYVQGLMSKTKRTVSPLIEKLKLLPGSRETASIITPSRERQQALPAPPPEPIVAEVRPNAPHKEPVINKTDPEEILRLQNILQQKAQVEELKGARVDEYRKDEVRKSDLSKLVSVAEIS